MNQYRLLPTKTINRYVFNSNSKLSPVSCMPDMDVLGSLQVSQPLRCHIRVLSWILPTETVISLSAQEHTTRSFFCHTPCFGFIFLYYCGFVFKNLFLSHCAPHFWFNIYKINLNVLKIYHEYQKSLDAFLKIAIITQIKGVRIKSYYLGTVFTLFFMPYFSLC